MTIDLQKKDAAMLLYALQMLLDFQQDNGYDEYAKSETRRVSQIVFDATLGE